MQSCTFVTSIIKVHLVFIIDKYLQLKESKRQKQIAELVRRNFGIVLQAEGPFIYGGTLVTVTNVIMSPDMSIAKIYVSVFNAEEKQEILILLNQHKHHLQQNLVTRIRRHVRRIPRIDFYLDDTLDEMYRLRNLFDNLHSTDQMGQEE